MHVQKGMQDAEVGLILLTTEPEIRYFSGFLTQFWQSPTRPWFLLLPVDGKPVAVIPGIGAECMRRSWVEDIRTWDSPAQDDFGLNLLASTIRELVPAGSRIGLPKGRETHLRMPLADFDTLELKLGAYGFSDVTALMRRLRSIKSAYEVAKIETACMAASRAFARIQDAVSAGMPETEVFRRFKILCLEEGVDDVSYLVGGAGRGGYRDIISPPSDRMISNGDVLMLDTGCIWDGYFCDFDRNFAVGDVSQETSDAHRRLWEATEAGLEAARPGVSCRDLHHAMKSRLPAVETGAGGVGRMGHGLGMQLTEFPSLTATDETLLEPGMVLTLEPFLALSDGKMLVHEENVVVTDSGVRLLTDRAAATLPVIPGS